MTPDEYDYIVVGSGAGGAAATYRLTRSGKRVLLLEKGARLPRSGITLDSRRVLREGEFKSREVWLDGKGRRFMPEEYFNLGGKTKWYGAALARFGEDEFLPDAARGFLPWPFDYDEMNPYYAQAGALLGVHQFNIEPDLQKILARLMQRNSGWRSAPLTLALSPEIINYPEELTHFDGFASPRGLKGDAESRLLARVEDLPNLDIVTETSVTGLLPDAANATIITGVRCADGRTYRAQAVLLAAGALHSPRLLARHLCATGLEKKLPNADLVGRFYKHHLLTAVLAFGPHVFTDKLRKTVLLLHRDLPHSSVQPLGGWVDREIVALETPRLLPGSLKRALGERVYGFFLQTEDGSDARNRVVAEGENTPPRLDYDAARLPAAVAEHRALVRRFQFALFRSGLLPVAKGIGLAGSAHSCGTLVTGADPRRAVVDPHGRVYGMQNLYVVDGSVLPRISRVNPALTICAWSLRVAHYLEPGGEPHEDKIAGLHTVRT
jgi:choline dehydrogenase-like flavoprotein